MVSLVEELSAGKRLPGLRRMGCVPDRELSGDLALAEEQSRGWLLPGGKSRG